MIVSDGILDFNSDFGEACRKLWVPSYNRAQ